MAESFVYELILSLLTEIQTKTGVDRDKPRNLDFGLLL